MLNQLKMKYIIPLLFTLSLISCSNDTNRKNPIETKNDLEVNPQPDSIDSTEKTTSSEYLTELDSVIYITGRGDTCSWKKKEYNNIINKHPEFFEDYPSDPELSYNLNFDFEKFGSEVGKDHYFIIYAHFLQMKNEGNQLKKERSNLIEIYTLINSIFQRLQYGGTYFGHQYGRILGLAEYSLHYMPKSKTDFEKTYDISKQKELYINSLRQLILDESSVDYLTLGEQKITRLKELNNKIDNLDVLISNIFYLRMAQELQYNSYIYY